MAQQQQSKTEAGTHTADHNKTAVPPTHVVVDPPFPTITTQSQPTNGQTQAEEKPWQRFLRPEWIIVYITAVYVLFTGLILLAIKRQADTMDQQAKDARDAAAAAALSAQKTLDAINRQADLMEKQLVVAHRAYLVIGEPDRLGGGIEAQFPIENVGGVAGRITSIDIEMLIRKRSHDIYRRSIKKSADESIVHGRANAFRLSVLFPREVEQDETFLVSGTIEYDIGFKSPAGVNTSDTLHFVRVYKGDPGKWEMAWLYFEIDFGEEEAEEKQRQNPN